ncbi:BT_3987 domain-containing protein [Pseudobacter ginsenosidimutans]|uniref:Uncharacterized protein DUF4361 n=1 Tax=Pseudobacter ginsenosidimutans TaxID=661488 RepID=A0A4Q7MQB7_9BACT|nr:DUF1735 domain-containing protein [Pseudobacter ginsenosidimutans]QEC40463.1 DUF1735 domain-containing protein [Pseudobacter ginsenosidimutans]RZS68929.1 uncharacterized protein DUF4361 [Pseudobacter ginsenosidimutans]
MNTLNKFLAFSCAGLLIVAGTGCLKDEAYDDHMANVVIDKNSKVIEVMGPIIGAYGQVLNFSTGDTSFKMVTVNLASEQPATEDIQVTLVVDPAVITEYNERNPTLTQLSPLPANNYNFQTLQITIPKGSREAELSGKIINPAFLETGKFALGMKIASTSPNYPISGNYGKQVIALRVKNKYHGLYHATGKFIHPTAGTRDIDEDKELVTVEPNSVQANLGDLGGSGYQMILTINPDNTVSIAKFGATPNIDYQGPNTYDPATKTFTLNYSYNGAGGPRIVREKIALK